MIRPSEILRIMSGDTVGTSLTPTSLDILKTLVRHGDPELHIPGLPRLDIPTGGLGSVAQAALEPVRKALTTALAGVTFRFSQTVCVDLVKGGVDIGGVGAKISEDLNLTNPIANVTVRPIVHFGGQS